MAPRRIDRCGARFRRGSTDAEPKASEPHVPETEELSLTGLGMDFIEMLRNDERFREIIADPFGDHPQTSAT